LSAVLAYPAGGSKNIVDSQNVVVVSGTLWTSLTLTPKSGTAIVSTKIVPVPNPLPEPNTTGLSPETAFRIPALALGTTYAVSAAFGQTGPCPIPISPAGSFATQ
jgi:hypothetical protein